MSRNVETLDISLLRNNKNEFVIRCQRIIAIIVKQYIATGMFSASDYDDIKQSVTLELIKRLPLIEKNYNGTALMVTYLNTIIINICLRIHEQESSIIVPYSLNDLWLSREENADDSMLSKEFADKNMLISNELERFGIALKLFYSEQYKILVCLKVYFSIPITAVELKKCFWNITDNDLERLMVVFGQRYYTVEEATDFNLLTEMVNKYEHTSTTEETLRRIILTYIQKFITVMNGHPPTRAHTKDSLKVLLEHYSGLHTNNN